MNCRTFLKPESSFAVIRSAGHCNRSEFFFASCLFMIHFKIVLQFLWSGLLSSVLQTKMLGIYIFSLSYACCIFRHLLLFLHFFLKRFFCFNSQIVKKACSDFTESFRLSQGWMVSESIWSIPGRPTVARAYGEFWTWKWNRNNWAVVS
jgi:hypothetical protein